MIFAGIDVGSVAAKAVILSCKAGASAILNETEIISTAALPTGWNPKESGRRVFEQVLCQAGIERTQVLRIVGTGYGRISLDFIDRAVTEITCHALGANYFFPRNNLVIDIGGQDSKAIQVNEAGKVVNFVMNDKCAAGTGRFLQVMAMTLGTDLDDLKNIKSAEPVTINSMCTVFAESEVVSLLASGVEKEKIISGLYHSICKRVSSMCSSLGSVNGVTFTGGVAKLPAMQSTLSNILNCSVQVPDEPQLIGALGAAILACRDYTSD